MDISHFLMNATWVGFWLNTVCVSESLIDFLIMYVPFKNWSLFLWRRHIAGEGLQNLGLCSVLRAFEQDGIFTMPHLL
jgi:hypothetical protein